MILIFITNILYAEKNYLNIDATHFEANEQKNIMYFDGNVKMTKNNDSLKCERLEINTMKSPTDTTKQIPKDYKATGDVEFTFYTQNSIFKGKGETVLYYPLDKKYIIIGDGYLEDVNGGKKIIANKIYVDEKTGHTRIEGEKDKPIKFRLKLDDTKK